MHAEGTIDQYAEYAMSRGLVGLLVTCHNPMPDGFSKNVRMRLDQFDEYVRLIAEARDRWEGRVDVRLGLEADYFEGYEAFLEQQLASEEFHFVLGSVHPQIEEFRERYWTNDPHEVQRTYFRLLAQSAETGLFDTISHPDLIKNFTAKDWKPEVIFDDICEALDRIAATGVAMELNTSGLKKTISEMNPFPAMLREMQMRNIPITIGADAHQPERVADQYEEALVLLGECGFMNVSLFSHRKRYEVPIADAIASLKRE